MSAIFYHSNVIVIGFKEIRAKLIIEEVIEKIVIHLANLINIL